MITQRIYTRRFLRKRESKRIKKAILEKYRTIKSLADEIGENVQSVYSIINGYSKSKRVATKIEKAVGQKLFPYTAEE